jgi:hypothetical protein
MAQYSIDKAIYKPSYKTTYYIGLACCLLWGVAMAWLTVVTFLNGIEGTPHFGLVLPPVFAVIFLTIPARVVKAIEFGDQILVRRYFWKTERYPYSKVFHVSKMGIELTDSSIRLYKLKDDSADELKEKMREMVTRGYLSEDQLTDDMILARGMIRISGPLFAAAALGIAVVAVLWTLPFAEPIVVYIENESLKGGHPFLTTALIAATVLYLPLDRLAKRAASKL